MHGDWFLDVFTAEAEKLIEKVKVVTASRGLGAPSYWWVGGLPEPAPKDIVVAAIDGGAGIQPLVSGGGLYLARAYGYTSSGEPERRLEMRLLPVRDSRVLDAFRSAVEHRAASSLVARLEPGSVLLMDGSLWVLLVSSLASIYRLASGKYGSLGSVYTSLASMELLVSLTDLLALAERRRVRVVYVSKDHSYRFLKEKIVLEYVASSVKGLERLVHEALSYYPLARREQLISLRRLVPQHLQHLYDAALDLSYRDVAFICDSVGFMPGYTWPTTLPPPEKLYILVLSRYSIKSLVEAACRRASELVSEEELGVCHDTARLVKALDRLPRVRAFYIRLSPGDHPLLVEVPGSMGDFYARGRVLEEPDEALEELIAVLVRDYAGPAYYNIPLVTAHLNATLRGWQMENYMRLLESLAAAKGVRLPLARRTMLGQLTKKPRRTSVRGL